MDRRTQHWKPGDAMPWATDLSAPFPAALWPNFELVAVFQLTIRPCHG
jgi:hypothetical protein